jgi:hypothetical protein
VSWSDKRKAAVGPIAGETGKADCPPQYTCQVQAGRGAGAAEPAAWRDHYGHDAGDRLARLTPSAASSPGWCDSSASGFSTGGELRTIEEGSRCGQMSKRIAHFPLDIPGKQSVSGGLCGRTVAHPSFPYR